jgi:hypothetical protein
MMLLENLIACLPVQDLSRWDFKGMLSWTSVMRSPGWGRLEDDTPKGT